MNKWYEYMPVDTMFFKGSEPMEKGINHTSSILFPPNPRTISGALRTAYLKQKQKPGQAITNVFNSSKVKNTIGNYGDSYDDIPFSVIGPIFKKGSDYYIPAPFSWFYAENEYVENDHGVIEQVDIIKSKRIKSPLLYTEEEDICWVKGGDNLKSIGGKWLKVENGMWDKNHLNLYENSFFYVKEPRTGIGLNYSAGRTVHDGMIYSFTHIRLNNDVSLVFGIDREINLEPEGILCLGGEKRFGRYKEIEIEDIPSYSGDNNYYMSLSSTKSGNDVNKNLISAGKPSYIGGWDMKKGFHKDLTGFYPAGSVFSVDIGNCLGIG